MQAYRPQRGREGPAFSLVFPTYNPGPILERTWNELCRFLEGQSGKWEALFVCDGCSDGSPSRLEKLSNDCDFAVRVLQYTPNRGKGYAVRRGLEAARGHWRIFTDIDLAYGFDDVSRVAERLRSGADVAIASRLHPESRLLVPPRLQGYAYRRYLQSLVFSRLVRVMLPLKQQDTQAGLKGISARAARLVLPHLQSEGFELDCELLTACVRHNLMVAEVPVCVRYSDAASTTSLLSVCRMIREIWRIRQDWRPRPLFADQQRKKINPAHRKRRKAA
jgi:dolichyl-phosphate beta-glucosyltransferase